MKPRLPPAEEQDWTAEQRQVLGGVSGRFGHVPNVFKTLIHHVKTMTSST